jgi:hypothetical protein
MEARSATLRDMDDVPRRRAGLVDRRQRHRLGRHAGQAEGNSERGSSKNLHRVFPFVFAADAAQSGLRKQYGSPVTHGVTETDRPTNGDGANGDAASGAAAKPNAGASNACANDAGAMPSPVPAMAPMDLHRLEMIDVVLCNDCGFYTLAAAERESRLRQDG